MRDKYLEAVWTWTIHRKRELRLKLYENPPVDFSCPEDLYDKLEAAGYIYNEDSGTWIVRPDVIIGWVQNNASVEYAKLIAKVATDEYTAVSWVREYISDDKKAPYCLSGIELKEIVNEWRGNG